MKKRKILIAENDPKYVNLIIEELGVGENTTETLIMRNGDEVMDHLQGKNGNEYKEILSQICLIIMDISLPKIQGMDILKFIKKNPKLYSIPVIMFSADTGPEIISRVYKEGADGFMTIPVSFKEFLHHKELLNLNIN